MRVSATTLESFRLWSDPEQEWMSEDSLIESIRGEFKPTEPVLIGKAFGKVLETPNRYRSDKIDGYECGGYYFHAKDMVEPLRLMDHDLGVFEAKGSRQYGDVTVVAMADQISGCRLVEHKTTLGTFDFDKYAMSCQWRFMADIFCPRVITYHVFRIEQHPDNSISVRGIESFNLFPYHGLHVDCAELVAKFADYARLRGLDGLLIERQRAAEAA